VRVRRVGNGAEFRLLQDEREIGSVDAGRSGSTDLKRAAMPRLRRQWRTAHWAAGCCNSGSAFVSRLPQRTGYDHDRFFCL
jgi:hypothetical protein